MRPSIHTGAANHYCQRNDKAFRLFIDRYDSFAVESLVTREANNVFDRLIVIVTLSVPCIPVSYTHLDVYKRQMWLLYLVMVMSK